MFEMTNYNHCAYLVQALDYFKDQHRLQLRKCENTHETLMGYAYSTFAHAQSLQLVYMYIVVSPCDPNFKTDCNERENIFY